MTNQTPYICNNNIIPDSRAGSAKCKKVMVAHFILASDIWELRLTLLYSFGLLQQVINVIHKCRLANNDKYVVNVFPKLFVTSPLIFSICPSLHPPCAINILCPF